MVYFLLSRVLNWEIGNNCASGGNVTAECHRKALADTHELRGSQCLE
ncbi:hypothetical protein SAMN04488518_103277 [Pseudovibrio ascidiaceicola]|uniref:Uncharacterized protein n=1 Tax=Pseudovibrio ascidiaceicola TaxID=285279 RepID=A0A1I3Y0X5_9HYPH|nr:hypothetical protein SAMN04488518_103277 [Pseudovibrio ascidiaceicola]